jgi:hypothetical protein
MVRPFSKIVRVILKMVEPFWNRSTKMLERLVRPFSKIVRVILKMVEPFWNRSTKMLERFSPFCSNVFLGIKPYLEVFVSCVKAWNGSEQE